MYKVTVPTYDELIEMFPGSGLLRITHGKHTVWEYHTDEMRIPTNRILEFPTVRSDGTMYDEHYDIFILKSFYDFLKSLEPQTFGSTKILGRPYGT